MKWEIPAKGRMLIAAAIVLLGLGVTPVRGGGYTVQVPRPNGSDDTAVLQAALDRCVAQGAGCTVQLAPGRYLTRQLVAYNFRGTLRGRGQDKTIIEALPNLLVNDWNPETINYWLPDPSEHPWPSLIIFVDGDIHVSDLGIQVTQVPATQPYELNPYNAPGWQLDVLVDAIRFMGQRPTNAVVERVAIEGREETSELGFFGFNLVNGVIYAGELPKLGTGIPLDNYPITGRLSVSSSSVKTAVAGVAPTAVKNSHVTFGGSSSGGNVFENVLVGVDLESLENSTVEVSHNAVSGARWAAAWAVPNGFFFPAKPSMLSFHDNTLRPTGPFADGIVLVDDPSTPWIRARVFDNAIEAQDIGYGGISTYNTKGTVVWNNRISGHGADGIGLWNSAYGALLANDLEDFIADYTADYGHAQIVLDATTSHTAVVCKTPSDTVLDQGNGNMLVGCQEVAAP